MRAIGIAIVCLATMSVASLVRAAETLMMTPFGFVDTSGEPRDQSAEHARRLAAMSRDIRQSLEKKGDYRVVAPPPGSKPCPDGDNECILKEARAAGADLVLAAAVQKASTMESNVWVGIFKADDGKRLFFRQLTFRGDTDDAWRHATVFLDHEIESHSPVAK